MALWITSPSHSRSELFNAWLLHNSPARSGSPLVQPKTVRAAVSCNSAHSFYHSVSTSSNKKFSSRCFVGYAPTQDPHLDRSSSIFLKSSSDKLATFTFATTNGPPFTSTLSVNIARLLPIWSRACCLSCSLNRNVPSFAKAWFPIPILQADKRYTLRCCLRSLSTG